jgi:flagellar biosynthesis protein FlgN
VTIPHNDGASLNLTQLLKQEVGCARRLVISLDQEYTALTQRDVPMLDTIVPTKRNLIAELELLGQQRERLLTQRSGPAISEKSENPFSDNALQAELWEELKSVAQQCQDKNRINGSIVEIGYRQSMQALDILRGVSADSMLYDKSGRTTKYAKLNPIIQA